MKQVKYVFQVTHLREGRNADLLSVIEVGQLRYADMGEVGRSEPEKFPLVEICRL